MDLNSINDQFVREYIGKNNLELLGYDEEKPWGGYYMTEEGMEEGKSFDGKILKVFPPETGKEFRCLSLQYHGNMEHPGHSEIWKCLNTVTVILGKESLVGKSLGEIFELFRDDENLDIITLFAGESVDIPSGFAHGLVNLSKENAYVVEKRISAGEETSEEREKNIIRIFDENQRDGLPVFPENIRGRLGELISID